MISWRRAQPSSAPDTRERPSAQQRDKCAATSRVRSNEQRSPPAAHTHASRPRDQTPRVASTLVRTGHSMAKRQGSGGGVASLVQMRRLKATSRYPSDSDESYAGSSRFLTRTIVTCAPLHSLSGRIAEPPVLSTHAALDPLHTFRSTRSVSRRCVHQRTKTRSHRYRPRHRHMGSSSEGSVRRDVSDL
eukprot:243910-Rhodomonas_salina.1